MTTSSEGLSPPPGPRPIPRVVIAGGGAAGTLVALHLTRVAARRDVGVEVVLVDPADRLGASAAFGTDDERHLLNVPASGMTAFPDEPTHFVEWRSAQRGQATDPYDFAPRREFAAYLAACLDEAVAAGGPVRLVRYTGRAVGVEVAPGPSGGAAGDGHVSPGVTVGLDDGTLVDAAALVVATGLGVPSVEWAPESLRASPWFLADPWAPGALARLRSAGDEPADLLVVGAGLTMIDIVLSAIDARPGRRVHAVSRSGRMPELHAPTPVTAHPVDPDEWGGDLDAVRAAVLAHVQAAVDATGDWRSGVDGLRPVTAALWQGWSEDDRLAFLAQDAGRWNRARHRTPLASARILDALEAEGRFDLVAAQVAAAEDLAGGGLRVTLDDGTVREVGWVVNAAGPASDVRALDSPLLDDLLTKGYATPATAGMGFVTVDGRLVDRDGSTTAPVWTLGALRRGELWESTAVPEIRTQAAALADSLVETLVDGLAPLGA